MAGCHHQCHQWTWLCDGQGSLACCSPWGHKELDMTEQLNWTWHVCWHRSGYAMITNMPQNFRGLIQKKGSFLVHTKPDVCSVPPGKSPQHSDSGIQVESTSISTFSYTGSIITWRRKWKPTPVFLPGKFFGQRILMGCSPWGYRELDTTERSHTHARAHTHNHLCMGRMGIKEHSSMHCPLAEDQLLHQNARKLGGLCGYHVDNKWLSQI